jgi:queuine tRNA-ribosyltransferase
MEEAKSLYVDQSALAERLRLPDGVAPEDAPELVIWDVGLGAAANAMAAVQCYEAAAAEGPVRRLKLISFENDLDSLRLALTHKSHFPYLRHSGPDAVLARGQWTSRQFPWLSWELLEGDFWERAPQASAKPDLVFYDFFSHKTDTGCWKPASFARLHALVRSERSAELFTYSASTAVRAGLLHAGFFVAAGVGTGVKKDTTIALTAGWVGAPRHALLGADWLGKWERSQAKFPEGLTEPERAAFAERIVRHPQFAG